MAQESQWRYSNALFGSLFEEYDISGAQLFENENATEYASTKDLN